MRIDGTRVLKNHRFVPSHVIPIHRNHSHNHSQKPTHRAINWFLSEISTTNIRQDLNLYKCINKNGDPNNVFDINIFRILYKLIVASMLFFWKEEGRGGYWIESILHDFVHIQFQKTWNLGTPNSRKWILPNHENLGISSSSDFSELGISISYSRNWEFQILESENSKLEIPSFAFSELGFLVEHNPEFNFTLLNGLTR